MDVSQELSPKIGKSSAPIASRFKKGQSGNPRGRPRGSKRQAPYENVLGQMVTVKEDGVTKRMTAAEAFLLHITRRGLEGDGAAARAAMTAIEEVRSRRRIADNQSISGFVCRIVTPGSVTIAMEHLRMAVKLDPYRDTARMRLEPWLIEAALERLEVPLAWDDQKKVWKATRTPWKVNLSAWWTYHE